MWAAWRGPRAELRATPGEDTAVSFCKAGGAESSPGRTDVSEKRVLGVWEDRGDRVPEISSHMEKKSDGTERAGRKGLGPVLKAAVHRR